MQEIVLVFLGALVLLFIARKAARKVGLVDKPNARKHHNGHIPLVGGVSVYLSLWLLYALQPGWLPDFDIYMICATLLMMAGVMDDRFDLPVLPRIGLQSAVAVIMMWHGLYLTSLGKVFIGYEIVLGAFGYIVTLLAVIGAINAFNMVDGIDGLLGALSSVTFGALGMVFYIGGNENLARWCLCLMAACLPYILLNLGIPWGKKFKVFMGDAGSTLIGFTVIWLLIVATQGPDAVMRPVTALWLIAVPLMDMLRVMITRIRRGDSPFKPDREHLHHLLLRAGFSSKVTAIIIVITAIIFTFVGVMGEILHISAIYMLLAFIAIFIFKLSQLNHVIEVGTFSISASHVTGKRKNSTKIS